MLVEDVCSGLGALCLSLKPGCGLQLLLPRWTSDMRGSQEIRKKGSGESSMPLPGRQSVHLPPGSA